VLEGLGLGGSGASDPASAAAIAPLDPDTLRRFVNAVGTTSGDKNFDPGVDLDADGFIGLRDLSRILVGERPIDPDWKTSR
jgi:hypothetical protein